MPLCKGTNYCTQCGEPLTAEEKQTQCQPICKKCDLLLNPKNEDTNPRTE